MKSSEDPEEDYKMRRQELMIRKTLEESKSSKTDQRKRDFEREDTPEKTLGELADKISREMTRRR